MKKLLFCLAILLPACATPGDSAWNGLLHANGFGGGISTTLSGSITVPVLELPDGESLGGDIPLSEGSSSSAYYGGRVGFALPILPFEFAYSMFNHSSSHPFSEQLTVIFDDPLNPGTDLEESLDVNLSSSLDFDVQKILFELDLFNSPLFRVGLLLGADLMTFNSFGIKVTDDVIYTDGLGDDHIIVEEGEGTSIATDQQLPIPMLGLRGDFLLPFTGLRAGVEVSGFSVDVEDVDVTYMDIDANLNYAFNDWTEAVIGYRSIALDLSGDLDDGDGGTTNLVVDIKYAGPYFGVAFVF